MRSCKACNRPLGIGEDEFPCLLRLCEERHKFIVSVNGFLPALGRTRNDEAKLVASPDADSLDCDGRWFLDVRLVLSN